GVGGLPDGASPAAAHGRGCAGQPARPRRDVRQLDAGGRERLGRAGRGNGHHLRSRSDTVMSIVGDTFLAVPAVLLGALASAPPVHAQHERGLARPPFAATVRADTAQSTSDTAPMAMVGDPIATATREYQASAIARTGVQGD